MVSTEQNCSLNPFTTIGIICPADFQKTLMLILSVVIAWDSIPTVYYAPVYRFWWILAIFRFTTSQCTVELSKVVRVLQFII